MKLKKKQDKDLENTTSEERETKQTTYVHN
jgi:hypothetical protein